MNTRPIYTLTYAQGRIDSLEYLSRLAYDKLNLRFIAENVSFSNSHIEFVFAQSISQSNIRILTFYYTLPTPNLTRLLSNSKIRTLNLHNCGFSKTHLDALAELITNSSIDTLCIHVGRIPYGTPSTFFSTLSISSSLTGLDLENTFLDPRDMHTLATNAINLVSLGLRHCRLKQREFGVLCTSMPKVTTLSLPHNYITDITPLARLFSSRRMDRIDLGGNPLESTHTFSHLFTELSFYPKTFFPKVLVLRDIFPINDQDVAPFSNLRFLGSRCAISLKNTQVSPKKMTFIDLLTNMTNIQINALIYIFMSSTTNKNRIPKELACQVGALLLG